MPILFFRNLLTQENVRVTLIMSLFFIVWAHLPKRPLTPCAISYLGFVMLNVMSSYVYRNIRLGFYRDYSITSSVIDRALPRPRAQSQSARHDIVFEHPLSTKQLEEGRDLEDRYSESDVVRTEVKVVGDGGSRDSKLSDKTGV